MIANLDPPCPAKESSSVGDRSDSDKPEKQIDQETAERVENGNAISLAVTNTPAKAVYFTGNSGNPQVWGQRPKDGSGLTVSRPSDTVPTNLSTGTTLDAMTDAEDAKTLNAVMRCMVFADGCGCTSTVVGSPAPSIS
jgi:hypothetical protein